MRRYISSGLDRFSGTSFCIINTITLCLHTNAIQSHLTTLIYTTTNITNLSQHLPHLHTQTTQATIMSSQSQQQSSSTSNTNYASSTYSVSSTQSSKPLLTSSTSNHPRSARAWAATKKVLASIGDPPNAEADRIAKQKEMAMIGREGLGMTGSGYYQSGANRF